MSSKSYNSELFGVAPYYNDFDESKKFLQILFRPGYAVQGRELIQLQTYLQSQVERFGSHIFKDGSLVTGAQITESNVKFIRVVLNDSLSYTDFIGKIIFQVSEPNKRAKVITAIDSLTGSNGTDEVIFFIEYLTGNDAFDADESFQSTDSTNTGTFYYNSGSGREETGNAILISVASGMFYVDGYFVICDNQTLPIYKISGSGSSSYRDFESITTQIGFDVEKTIVTSEDDSSLNDPAFGSYNYNSPGADRYKIELTLNQYTYTQTIQNSAADISKENFIELIRLVDDAFVRKIKYPTYSDIENTLARRTYDESGSYTVRPFNLSVIPGSTSSKLYLGLEPGKAYVFGYEYENLNTEYVEVSKARDTQYVSLTDFLVNFGNSYVTVETTDGSGARFGVTGAFNSTLGVSGASFGMKQHPIVNLYGSTANSSGVTGFIGTARITQILPVVEGFTSTQWNLYINDVKLTEGSTYTIYDIKRLFSTNGLELFKIPNGTTANIENILTSPYLLPAPIGSNIQHLYSYEMVRQVGYAFSFNNTRYNTNSVDVSTDTAKFIGTNVINGDITTSTLIDENYILVHNDTGKVAPFSATGPGSGNATTIPANKLYLTDAASPTGNYTLFAPVKSSNPYSTYHVPEIKSKRLTLTTENLQFNSSLGATLNNLDIYSIISATAGVTSITSSLTLDNGQRDYYYDFGKITTSNSGYSGVTFSITYSYFSRGTTGKYYTPESYIYGTTFAYENIPTYTSKINGKTYSLRDVIDFRGDVSSTAYGAGITGAISVKDGELIYFEYYNYLPRIDKVVLTKDRTFATITGISSLNPVPPNDRDDAMTLYVVKFNPYTLSENDVNIQYIENKRYTMRDIGKLEKRLDRLEYYTSLSLLEKEAESREFDEDVFKTGILVDSFNGHNIGDVTNPDYKCSIDFENGHLRSTFNSEFLGYTGFGTTSNVNITTDNILLLKSKAYDATDNIILQPLASSTIKPNPFGVVNWLGFMKIKPESDVWYSENTRPVVKLNLDGVNDGWRISSNNGFGTKWNDWETNWFGKEIINSHNISSNEILTIGATGFNVSNSIKTATEKTVGIQGSTRNKIQLTNLPENVVNSNYTRVVDTTVVPYNKNKILTVTCNGLKPNTILYPLFDSDDVGNYITPTVPFGGTGFTGTVSSNTVTFYNIPTSYYPIPGVTGSSILNAAVVFGSNRRTGMTASYSFVEGETYGTLELTGGTGNALSGSAFQIYPMYNSSKFVLFSEQHGNCGFTFGIPSDSYLSGSRLLRVVDNSESTTGIYTAAEKIYKISGISNNEDSSYVSVRNCTPRRETVEDERIVSNIFLRESTQKDTTKNKWLDPLTQTFTVDAINYPTGIFIGEIDLMFSAKDSGNLPITVQIRPTINGYPNLSTIIPFAEKTLLPENITVTSSPTFESSSYTAFSFDTPVFLVPGEYAICILTNSSEYELWKADLGAEEINEGTRITKQPYSGSLLLPQNGGNMILDSNADLMFRIKRVRFESSGSANFNLSGTMTNTSLVELISNDIRLTGTNVSYTSSGVAYDNNLVPFQKVFRTTSNTSGTIGGPITISLTTTSDGLSPIVDLERLGLVGVSEDVIGTSYSDSINTVELLYGITGVTSISGASSRYITKRINLERGFDANRLKVILNAYSPLENCIKVYAKIRTLDDDRDFSKIEYQALTPDTYNKISENSEDYVELVYDLSTSVNFDSFAIKICMFGDLTGISSPIIDDMKVISALA